MKKYIVTLLFAIFLATTMPIFASTASIATSVQTTRHRRVYRKRSFYQKHRDKITTAAGAGGGAIVGGLINGKKGAAIGTLAGGGGAALYTYKLRKHRHRRHY